MLKASKATCVMNTACAAVLRSDVVVIVVSQSHMGDMTLRYGLCNCETATREAAWNQGKKLACLFHVFIFTVNGFPVYSAIPTPDPATDNSYVIARTNAVAMTPSHSYGTGTVPGLYTLQHGLDTKFLSLSKQGAQTHAPILMMRVKFPRTRMPPHADSEQPSPSALSARSSRNGCG
ncbi:hypothetical protein EK21DRAFT_89856 [Setomelanomma holmii]|uniref:Uncharacterized protein n=1 Tax=Setomelanomma holmii TaxID=210430 RepID=A0A9P4H9C7_9PLEO|nr:hypothetical protein EK21DRAFT_89856 [Setomelanomma holmii]